MISPPAAPQRLLVVLPSWVGDVVMATPTLRALRQLYGDAQITYLARSYVRPAVDGGPWHDRLMVARPRRPKVPASSNRRRTPLYLAARLRRRRFDMAVLLPNSFRAALLVKTAGIPRRIGYDRDGRGLLLTDRLLPVRSRKGYQPVSAIDYYLGLARYLGAAGTDRRMELFTRPEDDARAAVLLEQAGVAADATLVLINPGAANRADAKLWPAARFGAVADALADRWGATVLMNGSPRERPILDAVRAAARRPLIDLAAGGSDLTLLKSIVRRCALMVTNDTGARHIAAALGTPVLSLFGPTDPRWTHLGVGHEVVLRRHEACPACTERKTGRRHTCMEALTIDLVLEHAGRLLAAPPVSA